MHYFALSGFLTLIILFLFFFFSKKEEMSLLNSSVFECGFTSYYFSRFSFSMHYFMIGLVFLFLDLELCYLLPFFNSSFCEIKIISFLWVFIVILITGLLEEWKFGMLDWKF